MIDLFNIKDCEADLYSLKPKFSKTFVVAEHRGREIEQLVQRINANHVRARFRAEVGPDKTRVNRLPDIEPPPARLGRPMMYTFDKMEVGDEQTFDLPRAKHVKIRNAAKRAADNTGWKIVAAAAGDVITVRRMPDEYVPAGVPQPILVRQAGRPVEQLAAAVAEPIAGAGVPAAYAPPATKPAPPRSFDEEEF